MRSRTVSIVLKRTNCLSNGCEVWGIDFSCAAVVHASTRSPTKAESLGELCRIIRHLGSGIVLGNGVASVLRLFELALVLVSSTLPAASKTWITARCDRLRNFAHSIASVTCSYHSRPNGSASEIRSPPRCFFEKRTSKTCASSPNRKVATSARQRL